MAEQLALQQLGRTGRAVDADEGPAAFGESLWMTRAMSSLPVPLSPLISTVARLLVTLPIAP